MDNIAEWLASITWPLVSRVLTAMGFGYVTYEGTSTAVTSALTAAKGAFTGLMTEVLQLLVMIGFFDAMSIMSGGIVSGLAWMVAKKMAIQTTGGT